MKNWLKFKLSFFNKASPMLSEYQKETFLDSPVIYLNEDERQNCKLTFLNGLVYKNGKLYTSFCAQQSGTYSESALYAIDLTGNFYAKMKPADGTRFHHSSILGGKPVICAGFLVVKDGKIQSISNCSGHYKPDLGNLIKAIYLLRKAGIPLNSFAVFYEAPGSIRPTKYATALEFLEKVAYPKKHSSPLLSRLHR